MTPEAISLWLSPPDPYLWKWDEDGHALWQDGSTIAVREEITAFLAFLAPSGLPPVGSLLFLLMACRGHASKVRSAALDCAAHHQDSGPPAPMLRLVTKACRVLDSIAALPADLRSTAPAKSRLIHFILGNAEGLRSPDDSAAILTAFLANPASISRPASAHSEPAALRLQRDLRAIAVPLPAPAELASRLTTGMATASLNPTQLPEPPQAPLLPQLDEHPDPTVRAIANAARRMVAFTSIPLPAGSLGQLPIGGVSGITQQGQPDRLLLSELASDDLTLHARLATGEALFLEREAPLVPSPRHRMILLDSGVHTWGIIRILSLSAAIGLTDSARRIKAASVSFFRKTGRRFSPAPLRSPEDLTKLLAELLPDTRTDSALLALPPPEHPELTDLFFITSDPAPPDSSRAFHELCGKLTRAGARCFSLTIARSGAVRISRDSPVGPRLLSSAQINPLSITGPLQQTPSAPEPPASDPADLMACLAFYRPFPPPLDFPLPIPPEADDTAAPGWCAVTPNGFLFHWTEPTAPARLVTRHPLPPANDLLITRDPQQQRWIVAAWPEATMGHPVFHIINANGEISSATAHHASPVAHHAVARGDAIVLIHDHHAEAFLASDGSPRASLPLPGPISPDLIAYHQGQLVLLSPDSTPQSCPPARPPVTSSPPTIMEPPLSAGFDSANQLILRTTGGRWLLSTAELSWQITARELLAATRPFRPLPQRKDHPDLPPRFYMAEWHPGCRLVFDTLGVLHLIAAHPTIPIETAILCILGKPAVPWHRDSHPKNRGQPDSLAPTIRRFADLARHSA